MIFKLKKRNEMKKINYLNLKLFYLFFAYFGILVFWISVDHTNIYFLYSDLSKKLAIHTFDDFRTKVRTYWPLLLLIVGIVSFFLSVEIIKQLKKNKVVLFFLLYVLSCIVGLFTSSNWLELSINNMYLLHLNSSVYLICYLFFIQFITKNKFEENIFYSFIFLILALLTYILLNTTFSYGETTTLTKTYTIFLNSNGISRYVVILQIFFLSLYFFNDNLNEFYKKLLVPVIILTYFMIFIFESRMNSVIITILSFLFIYFRNSKNIKKEFLKNIFNLLLAFFAYTVFVFYFYPQNATYKESRLKYSINQFLSPSKIDNKYSLNKNEANSTNIRFNTWRLLAKEGSKNIIFGSGDHSDRFFLKKNKTLNTGGEAGNSIVYVFFSAGIFGVIFFLLFYFFLARQLYLNIQMIKNEKIKINFKICFSIMTIIYFITRSVVEVSFATWGIDAIIMFFSISLLKKTKLT